MRDDIERLRDIVAAIERIEKYVPDEKTTFDEQELIQTWIVYHLQIVGEAARAISKDFKADHLEVPWREIGDLRNLTIHEYFHIDLEIIWDIVQNDIPPLKRQIETILRN
jgi:uncharacterized protein with HEPN domain